MTIVTAAVSAGTVHMVADRITYAGDDAIVYPVAKIHRLRPPAATPGTSPRPADTDVVLYGAAGRRALGVAIANHLRPQRPAADSDTADQDEWAQAVARSASDIARDARLLDEEGFMDGSGLLAWRHRLWVIQDMLAVPVNLGTSEPYDRPFAAIGNGAKVALGAMWATWTGGETSAARLASIGVHAAANILAGIGGDLDHDTTATPS